jgi:hypothetical protein
MFHYTSVDTAYEILRGRTLWASDVLSMNDPTEFSHAVALVDEVLMSHWNVLPIDFAQYFRPQTILDMGRTWNAFASSFSADGDLLSQWLAYPPRSNAEGVSIGLSFSELYKTASQSLSASPSPSFSIVRISYSTDELRKAVIRICDVALDLAASRPLIFKEAEIFWSEVAKLLFGFALRFKNPSYIAEREWRLLKLGPDRSKVMRRIREGTEVKFIHLCFSTETITRINIGPRAAQDTEVQLRRSLADNGFGRVKMERSAIPFR